MKRLTIHALDAHSLADLQALFETRGCSQAKHCWCTYYRLSGVRAAPQKGQTRSEANRAQFAQWARSTGDDKQHGLLAYVDDKAVGWLSLGPREQYARLKNSPVMKPVDDKPVWSLICFVVAPEYRGQGVAHALLKAAIAYCKTQGATLLEAYPVDKPVQGDDDTMWFGPLSMYAAAGFAIVARRKETRPMVRLSLVP